jgi:ABC-2 type transport system ATP-binding protein
MIHVENLTKNYGDIAAVDQINFEIQKGEILGLLGPNGAGKTTTLRMLTGFLRPSAGTIRVKEIDIDRHPIEIKKIMGYLPESAPLYHDMLVFDYLNYVADIREIPPDRKRARIRELGDLCGLNPVMHMPIAELSKGFKQRVGLAHAMMSDPEILILDEATCDRVVIISHGKIVADGDIDKLKQSAGGTSLIHLTLQRADSDAVRQKLSATAGVQGVVSLDDVDGQLRITLSVPSTRDLRGEIYRTVKQTDWELLEFYQESRTLETVFRELTKEN